MSETPRASRHDTWGLAPEGSLSIGLALSGGGGPPTWQRELAMAKRADELGLHSVWVPEMHFMPGACASPVVALFALAAATERVRIASTSMLLPIHDAAALGRDLALLDRASGGRLIVGLGRGFRPALFEAFGVDASQKRDLFDAALDTLLEVWQRESVSPPLAVAAFGPKGLAQAARRALPYLPSMIESPDALEENYRAHAADLPAGARPNEIVVPVLRTVHVAADDLEAERVLEGLRRSPPARGGARLPKNIERAAQTDPIERAIVGTASEVADRIAALRERIGLDLLIVAAALGAPGSFEERAASLERLVADVLPQLH